MERKNNPLCACGCGGQTKRSKWSGNFRKFIIGHSKGPLTSKPLSKEARKKMSDAKKGVNNPRWSGGKTPNGLDFTPELKAKIRNRDGNKCQNPNCPKTSKKMPLQIHRINYDRKDNGHQNLITLCHGCNIRASFNKENWTELYQQINERRLKNG
jgi:hypothetical protein